jgi:hypothetical protein
MQYDFIEDNNYYYNVYNKKFEINNLIQINSFGGFMIYSELYYNLYK